MRIALSPAKNMCLTAETDRALTLPAFEKETMELAALLRSMSLDDYKDIMKVNDKLAALNKERYKNFCFDTQGMPAILAYDGQQYKMMEAEKFNAEEQQYAQKTIRILDGLYGVLRPYDSICPYRLEMKNKLHADQTLCKWWDDKIYKKLAEETDVIVNLASSEYSRVLLRHVKSPVTLLTCTFKIRKNNVLKVESTQAKQARGMMAGFVVREKITTVEDLKAFNKEGYQYNKELSTPEEFIYVKETA